MADTRIVETSVNEDPRKSISAAPSFEEYLKQRAGGDAAAPAAAPAAAAPAAAAPAAAAGGGGGDLLSTLKTLEGPGQVWGHEGKHFFSPSMIEIYYNVSYLNCFNLSLFFNLLTLYLILSSSFSHINSFIFCCCVV